MNNDLRVGPVAAADGVYVTSRGDRQGDQVVSDGHLRLHEANFRGTLYTYGVADTALVAANATATGVTATAQPVIGLWNPLTSLVNLVVYKVHIFCSTIANTAVSP